MKDTIGRKGELHLIIDAEKVENIKYSADKSWIDKEGRLHLIHHNAYVNTGLNNSLDREFGVGGTAVGFIGVSSNTTAVTATTVNLNGATGRAASNTIIKPISPAASRT